MVHAGQAGGCRRPHSRQDLVDSVASMRSPAPLIVGAANVVPASGDRYTRSPRVLEHSGAATRSGRGPHF